MNKRLKRWCVGGVVAALAVVNSTFYLSMTEKSTAEEAAATTSTDGAAAASPAPAAGSTYKPPQKVTPLLTTKSIASNSKFEMFIDENGGNIRIVDKATGKEWNGAPQVDQLMSSANKSLTQSPIVITHTTGISPTTEYPIKEDTGVKIGTTKVSSIENGARVDMTLIKAKISLAVEYRLTDRGVDVKIPDDSIKEEGIAKIVNIEVLPFFDSAEPSEKGGILIPDGSGAVMDFGTTRTSSFETYSEFIYGGDRTFLTQVNDKIYPFSRRGKFYNEKITLPMFGIFKENKGLVGVVTGGETSAQIVASPAGIRNIDRYRGGVAFYYRHDDVIYIGQSGQIPIYQAKRIPGDRSVSYILLGSNPDGYVGLAKSYRDYLIKDKGVQPAPTVGQTPFQLTLVGGAMREEIFGASFIDMTTFDQAKKILDEYAANGVSTLDVTLEGWNKDGLYGTQPNHFPVAGQLGGAKGLENLAAYAKEKGIQLYLKTNYVRSFDQYSGINQSKEAVYRLDKQVLDDHDYWLEDRYMNRRKLFYLLKPAKSAQYVEKEVDKWKSLGISGVSMGLMGDLIYSDQDSKSPTDRAATKASFNKSIELLRKTVGKASVDYGLGYVLGNVDRIDGAPTDSSNYVYMSRTVPFYQLVVHGLVPYTAMPSNLADDSHQQTLKAIEYGAMPSYRLTYENSDKLMRTFADDLFSTMYSHWLKTSAEEYKRTNAVLQQVADQQMTNHEKLQDNVFRTTYANGVQVIVNYNVTGVTVDGQSVPAEDYVVVKGGAAQ